MEPDQREALLRQALECLRRLGYKCAGKGDATLSVDVAVAGGAARLRFQGEIRELLTGGERTQRRFLVPDKPPETPSDWLWLSPVEEEIVRAVSPDDWTTADKIAAACGGVAGTEFRVILKNLVDRGVLVSGPSRGYKLNLGRVTPE